MAFSDAELRALLERARRNNAALDITGILLLVNRSFFQILEGAPDAIAPLYEKISADKRHARVAKLIQEPIKARDFQQWSMGLARITSVELAALPGVNDFFTTNRGLEALGEGTARKLLGAFREGRWRARVGA